MRDPRPMTTLPERLQWILDNRKWSQRELARKAGLKSETHVGLLIKQTMEPHVGTLAQIADAAGVRVDWLISGNEPIEEPPERTVISDRIHPTIQRVAEAMGFDDERVAFASSAHYAFGGTAEMTEVKAAQLLAQADMMIRTAAPDPGVLRVAESGATYGDDSGDDDIGGGIGDAKAKRRR